MSLLVFAFQMKINQDHPVESASLPVQKGTTAGLRIGARPAETLIPAFNIPYLPMMEPVVAALRETDSFGLIAVARLEWVKFEAGGLRAVFDEYQRVKDERHTRLHLDHVPVIDEDDLRVDFEAEISAAIRMGYQSVMVDGSRLPLEENIEATRKITDIAHAAGIPVEGELGAVLGHEAGPLPPYEELFRTGRGFTSPAEAQRFVAETGVDWLSVAVGSVHGPLMREYQKLEARLDLEHLQRIHEATGIPLVLHGGSGIKKEYILEATRRGIAKINIGTVVRRAYQDAVSVSVLAAQRAVHDTTVQILTKELDLQGSRCLVYLDA
jgi:fructose-bisphosphate aldolase class II